MFCNFAVRRNKSRVDWRRKASRRVALATGDTPFSLCVARYILLDVANGLVGEQTPVDPVVKASLVKGFAVVRYRVHHPAKARALFVEAKTERDLLSLAEKAYLPPPMKGDMHAFVLDPVDKEVRQKGKAHFASYMGIHVRTPIPPPWGEAEPGRPGASTFYVSFDGTYDVRWVEEAGFDWVTDEEQRRHPVQGVRRTRTIISSLKFRVDKGRPTAWSLPLDLSYARSLELGDGNVDRGIYRHVRNYLRDKYALNDVDMEDDL